MRVIILDVEWYNKKSFTPNIKCMKLSSYHQQLGHLVNLAENKFDLTMDFDTMYVVRENIGGSLPPELKLRDERVNLIGPGFKFYDRYMKELPDIVAACKPDYMLYPIKEENKVSKADMIQFYNNGKRLNLIQDYESSYRKAKLAYVVDEHFWEQSYEDIKKCTDILSEKNYQNVVFQKPISLKSILSRENVRSLFINQNFMKDSMIHIVNDCDNEDYQQVFDFLVEFKQKHKNKFPAVHFKSLTFDHNQYPEKAYEDVKRCIELVVKGKEQGVQIYIDSPSRMDTPFWYYFEELEFWCKYRHKQSFIEHMLTTASMMHRTTIYNVMMNRILWSSVQAEMLGDLIRKDYNTIDKYGWLQWEGSSFPRVDLTKIIQGVNKW